MFGEQQGPLGDMDPISAGVLKTGQEFTAGSTIGNLSQEGQESLAPKVELGTILQMQQDMKEMRDFMEEMVKLQRETNTVLRGIRREDPTKQTAEATRDAVRDIRSYIENLGSEEEELERAA